MFRVLVFVMAVMGTFVCQAQVYKCTGADGSVTFSDKACGDDAAIVKDLDPASTGIGMGVGGPPSSLTLGDGSILAFKKIISIEVKTESGYRTGKEGMHIHYEGTDHLVEFENLVSLSITSWDRKPCGNTGHLCEPRVRIQTKETEISARYQALRNIKVLVDDKLDGEEKEMTIWFGSKNRPQIRAIRF